MCRWTREGGQTSAEMLGLVVVVGGIILAIATSNLGGRIADGMTAMICRITGGECAAAEESSGIGAGTTFVVAGLEIALG